MKETYRKFKRWMEFYPPASGTSDAWTDFEIKYRKEAPVRHWFTSTLPYMVYYPIKWRWTHFWDAIRYRVVKYHVVDTKLKPRWHDKDTLMLHANFSLLVDYVECEKAHRSGNDDRYSKRDRVLSKIIPYYYERYYRNPEAGMSHIDWELTLDDPKLPLYERSPEQAKHAKAVKELYLWWTKERPARRDLIAPERDNDDNGVLYFLSDRYKEEHPEEYRISRIVSKENGRMEIERDQEDEDMLLRLVKIRKGLWT